MSAELNARKACRWVSDHPSSYKQLVQIVDRARRNGFPRVQRGDIYVLARQQGMTITESKEFRREHSLWSGITRIMRHQHPELASVLYVQKSPIDEVNIGQMFDKMKEDKDER